MKIKFLTTALLLCVVCACNDFNQRQKLDPYQRILIVNQTDIEFSDVYCLVENSDNVTYKPSYNNGSLWAFFSNGDGYTATMVLRNEASEVVVDTTFVMEPYADTSAGRTVFCTMQADSTFVITSKFTYAD